MQDPNLGKVHTVLSQFTGMTTSRSVTIAVQRLYEDVVRCATFNIHDLFVSFIANDNIHNSL
jgi:hypothetical protein